MKNITDIAKDQGFTYSQLECVCIYVYVNEYTYLFMAFLKFPKGFNIIYQNTHDIKREIKYKTSG